MYNLILESKTIEDFGETLHLDRHDIEHLRSVFLAVENGDLGKFTCTVKMIHVSQNDKFLFDKGNLLLSFQVLSIMTPL